jgi:hypothetical protein
MTTPAPTVTDHALIRYLERVRGFSSDRERSQIRDICRGVQTGTVKAFGCNFEVEGGRVITVTPGNQYPSRTKLLKLGVGK